MAIMGKAELQRPWAEMIAEAYLAGLHGEPLPEGNDFLRAYKEGCEHREQGDRK